MRARLFLSLVCLGLLLLSLPPFAHAQQEGLLFLDGPVHRFLERQIALGHLPDATLSHRPLSAYEAQRYLDTLALGPGRARGGPSKPLTRVDRQLLARFRGAAPAPGAQTARRLIPFTYRDGQRLLSIRTERYGVEVGPLLYLTYGQARQTDRPGRDQAPTTWRSARGVRAGGHLGKHLFFEARLTQHGRRPVQPEYEAGMAPRVGEADFDGAAYDYVRATGALGVRSRYFEVRLGRTRNHWGHGAGSVALSSFPAAYTHLQLRTTVWRFQYTSLFIGRSAPGEDATGRLYGALHRLEVRLPGRVRWSFFESVMFASSDTTGLRDRGFEISYMNPVLFLRAADAERGSPDNVLLGTGLSWVPVAGLQLYGQFILDELKFEEIGNQWWGNKWGWLAGVYLVGWPLANGSARVEVARLRPYLYAHRDPSTAYLHHRDVLGHPAGPNAIDVALFLDYQPTPRLRAALTVAHTRRGRSTDAVNYGEDPAVSYRSRPSSRGIAMLQGVRQATWLVEARAAFELLPGLHAGAALVAESVDDAERGLDRYVVPVAMLRWGLPFQSLRY